MPRRPAPRIDRALLVLALLLAHVLAAVWLARLTARPPALDSAGAPLQLRWVKVLHPAEPGWRRDGPRLMAPRPHLPPSPQLAAPRVELAASSATLEPAAAAPEAVDAARDPAPAGASDAPQPAADWAALALEIDPPAFDWPPSTRMRYALRGHYRGPVEGSAQVVWIREAARYRVELDVIIGLKLAPVMRRQMRSEGGLSASAGLVPQRYHESTRVGLRDPWQAAIRFADDHVQLPRLRTAPHPGGVQDAVSQFLQWTWRFSSAPWLLTPGRTLEMPLALPSGVSTWVYDVGEPEPLWTEAGEVQAYPLRPRRRPRRGGDLVVQAWFVPALQYLPLRIRIQHDELTWVELEADELPRQAESPKPAGR